MAGEPSGEKPTDTGDLRAQVEDTSTPEERARREGEVAAKYRRGMYDAGVEDKTYGDEWLRSKRFDPEDATALADKLGVDVGKIYEERKFIIKSVLGMIDRRGLDGLVRLEKLGREAGKVHADDWLTSERWGWGEVKPGHNSALDIAAVARDTTSGVGGRMF